MAKSSKKLRAALQSQQGRFKEKQKLAQAAQAAEHKFSKTKSHRNESRKGERPRSSRGAGAGAGSRTVGDGGNSSLHHHPFSSLSKSATIQNKPTVPFRPTDRILLVGEGDFSFAHALVFDPPPSQPSSSTSTPAPLSFLPPSYVTATAHDSEESCYQKYPRAREIVRALREKGVHVVFEVDATKLEKLEKRLGGGGRTRMRAGKRKWDRVVWNFPHAGKGITDQNRNILSNQLLLLGFLRSAAKVLTPGPIPASEGKGKKRAADDGDDDEDDDKIEASGPEQEEGPLEGDELDPSLAHMPREPLVRTRGTVLITLRNVSPYTQWDLPRLAKRPPLPQTPSTPPNPQYIQLRSFMFHRHIWKGYEHRMTKGERAGGTGKTGQGGEDRTWEFYLKDVELEE